MRHQRKKGYFEHALGSHVGLSNPFYTASENDLEVLIEEQVSFFLRLDFFYRVI